MWIFWGLRRIISHNGFNIVDFYPYFLEFAGIIMEVRGILKFKEIF